MLNLADGTILLGVEDDGTEPGLTRSREDAQHWVMNGARQNLQPSTTLVWGCMRMDGGIWIGVVKLPPTDRATS